MYTVQHLQSQSHHIFMQLYIIFSRSQTTYSFSCTLPEVTVTLHIPVVVHHHSRSHTTYPCSCTSPVVPTTYCCSCCLSRVVSNMYITYSCTVVVNNLQSQSHHIFLQSYKSCTSFPSCSWKIKSSIVNRYIQHRKHKYKYNSFDNETTICQFYFFHTGKKS